MVTVEEVFLSGIQKLNAAQVENPNLDAKVIFKHILSVNNEQFELCKKNEISRVDLIHILPHEKELKKFRSFYEKIIKSISKLASNHFNIAVKHHPFERDNLYSIHNNKVKTIPADIAFEYIIPVLKKGAIIVGDVSTVLLTAKWIRPDLNLSLIHI